jgi:hypothetical protein
MGWGVLGWKHKAATANSKHRRTSVGGLNKLYGNGHRISSAEETNLAMPSNNIGNHTANSQVHDVNLVVASVAAVDATGEPLATALPTVVPSIPNNYFVSSNFDKNDTAIFTSLNMTRIEYCELLVTHNACSRSLAQETPQAGRAFPLQ